MIQLRPAIAGSHGSAPFGKRQETAINPPLARIPTESRLTRHISSEKRSSYLSYAVLGPLMAIPNISALRNKINVFRPQVAV